MIGDSPIDQIGGGWAAAASQNINYLMGKILRVNVDTPNVRK